MAPIANTVWCYFGFLIGCGRFCDRMVDCFLVFDVFYEECTHFSVVSRTVFVVANRVARRYRKKTKTRVKKRSRMGCIWRG